MYSVNLLGLDGELFTGQDFEDRDTARAVYNNPEKYFARSEFGGAALVEITGDSASRRRLTKSDTKPAYSE